MHQKSVTKCRAHSWANLFTALLRCGLLAGHREAAPDAIGIRHSRSEALFLFRFPATGGKVRTRTRSEERKFVVWDAQDEISFSTIKCHF